MAVLFAIYVRSHDFGLPWWQEVPLTIVSVGIAFAILYGLYRLVMLPRQLRIRSRAAAVEAAAGDDAVFGATAVRAGAEALFAAVYAGWDATDPYALGRVSHPNLMATWQASLDANRGLGLRYRSRVRGAPRIDYVGVVDLPGEEYDHVVVRVRAKLREYLEHTDGSHSALPRNNGAEKVAIEEYWTLSRHEGRWILYSVLDAEQGAAQYLSAEIVAPAGAAGV